MSGTEYPPPNQSMPGALPATPDQPVYTTGVMPTRQRDAILGRAAGADLTDKDNTTQMNVKFASQGQNDLPLGHADMGDKTIDKTQKRLGNVDHHHPMSGTEHNQFPLPNQFMPGAPPAPPGVILQPVYPTGVIPTGQQDATLRYAAGADKYNTTQMNVDPTSQGQSDLPLGHADMGDKIIGKTQKVIGKMTNNPELHEKGELRESGGLSAVLARAPHD